MNTRFLRHTTRRKDGRRVIMLKLKDGSEQAEIGVSRGMFPVYYKRTLRYGEYAGEERWSGPRRLRGFFILYPHLIDAVENHGGTVE